MEKLSLHHYGFLTNDTAAWLAENELVFGKPYKVFDTIKISSQKVNITFVQQSATSTLTELVEPSQDNSALQKMMGKGITIYHTGYLAAAGGFDNILACFVEKGAYALPAFHSEAFGGKRCVFVITRNMGMIEIIEQ